MQQSSAIIIGGGSGLGLASARRLLARGLAVGLTSRSAERLAEARAVLLSKFPSAVVAVYAADAGIEEQAQAAIAALAAELGDPEVLVVSAGVYEQTHFTELTSESWDATMSGTLNAFVFSSVAAARLMKLHSSGRIVLIGSTSGFENESGSAAYCAAKAATHSLVKSICVDLARDGITANAVAPGWIRTEMTEEYVRNLPDDVLAQLNPVQRVGDPDEVANLVEYLALDAPTYLTGAVILIDGGQTAAAPVL